MTDDFSDAQKIEDLSNALRERAALAALTGLLAGTRITQRTFDAPLSFAAQIAKASVDIADALVARLKEGK